MKLPTKWLEVTATLVNRNKWTHPEVHDQAKNAQVNRTTLRSHDW
jgi:hypothetical protein